MIRSWEETRMSDEPQQENPASSPLTVSVHRSVASVDDVEDAHRELNPILRGIVKGVEQSEALARRRPTHIKASFSLSY
jgi:hypothetical protein